MNYFNGMMVEVEFIPHCHIIQLLCLCNSPHLLFTFSFNLLIIIPLHSESLLVLDSLEYLKHLFLMFPTALIYHTNKMAYIEQVVKLCNGYDLLPQ